MKSLLFSILLFCGIAFSLFSQDTNTIIIMHTNDMHAHIDNYAKLKYIKDSLSAIYNDVFLFSAGDIFTGNPKVDRYTPKGYPMIDLMNRVQYDVSELGNHAFDYTQKVLADRIKQSQFPFICANIKMESSPLSQTSGRLSFYTSDSTRIEVLGLLQVGKNGLPDAYPPKLKGLKFINPFKTLKLYHNQRPQADIHILLSHMGYKSDLKIANRFHDFDIIIGGHSHTYLPHGIIKKKTLIVQAKSYMKYVGILTIQTAQHHIVKITDSLINLNHYTNYDTTLQAIINQYNINPELDKIITHLKSPIRTFDSLGILITDAMRQYLKTDVAIQNNGGIRIDSLPSTVTYNLLYQMMPFGNQLVTYQLSRHQLKRLIRYAYNLHHSNELSISGISFKLNISKYGKLKSISLFDEQGNPLRQKLFSISVNDYMSSAYKLPFFKRNGTQTGVVDVETVITYLKQRKRLN